MLRSLPAAILLWVLSCIPLSAQIRYASGQDVVPVFEGWERNPDASFNMVFGYMNRNYEEQVDVPVGPQNRIEPGPIDQGQPAHFYPRRQEFVFKVRVPKDWGDKDLIWTLESHGKVEKAYASLLPIWELGTLVYLENRRGAGALTFPEEPNKPPTIEMVGSSSLSVLVGQPLKLSVDVTDDGYPKPRARSRSSRPRQTHLEGPPGLVYPSSPAAQAVVKLEPGVRLGVTWVVYRSGGGTAEFDPMHVGVVSADDSGSNQEPGRVSGRAITTVTFSAPGTYTLRAYADDGVLMTPQDVKVTVTAATPPPSDIPRKRP